MGFEFSKFYPTLIRSSTLNNPNTVITNTQFSTNNVALFNNGLTAAVFNGFQVDNLGNTSATSFTLFGKVQMTQDYM